MLSHNSLALVSTLLAVIACRNTTHAITVETVPVGDVGNPNDPLTGNLFGGVDYAYRIGKYEVTVGEYTAFLNAVADTDLNSLYHPSMATNRNIAGIARSGSPGSYSYSVIGSPNHPVTYVNWGDAVRFANWLHNGQPTGVQNSSTTEDGAYDLHNATSAAALMTVSRNAGARWVLPTENEWYKAAYYQPADAGGDADGYWAYPLRTNSLPYSDQPPGATPDNTRVGNFYNHDGLVNGYDDGYAVTGSLSYSSTQNYLTDVGSYTKSHSYYGAFNQADNVWEWNETARPGARGVRGGAWELTTDATFNMHASDRGSSSPTFTDARFGFRVARIPEPGTLLIAAIAILGPLRRRRGLLF